ncbi:RES family NAD+ phosphorylase [Salinarimonas rosea]|uniref:RES family NAD+ phosphorylase n=1 Tax=Salinarimonas rosea TaxID=552063 RepID=UPI00048F0496|nr:RES domain-containing protein [Salinarimonas rosea]
MRYAGLLYRALHPRGHREPLAGEGARLHGGRFNPTGLPALYTALSVAAAIREANQVGTLQPTTVVAYEADIEPIFDASDETALARYGTTREAIAADDWRLRMREEGRSPSQRLAERLVSDGFAGMKVRSFARGAGAADSIMVLWAWGPHPPMRLTLVDDEGRLA